MWKVAVSLVVLGGVASADDALPAPPATPVVTKAKQDERREGERPPRSGGRIVGEAALGTALSVGLGVGGIYGGLWLGRGCDDQRGEQSGEHTCGLLEAFVLGVTGVAVGGTVGVLIVGRAGNQTGSIVSTAGGALVGLAFSGAAYAWTGNGPAGVTTVLVLPALGATLGFNLTRRYEHVTLAPVATNHTIGLAGTF